MSQIKGVYNATPPTVRDGQNEDIQLNVNGDTKVELNTGGVALSSAANTDRTTATKVIPVQHIDATGTVGGVTMNTALAGEDIPNDVLKVETRGSYYYQAAAAANVVVKGTAGFLYGIIIGKDVAGSVIEISDSATDGDGAVKIMLTGDTLMTSTKGYLPVNASFATGITADITNQTDVTFIYR